MMSSEIVDTLLRSELFGGVDQEDIERIASICRIEAYNVGDTIVAQGEFGQSIYLIAEGQVAITRSINLGGRQGSLTVDVLGKGRGFGWSSMLCDPCSVSASATCQRPTTLVSISGTDLRNLLETRPELGYRVMDRLAQILGNRLRAAYGAIDTFR